MFKASNKSIFIVSFEHISHLALSSLSIVNFGYVIADWTGDMIPDLIRIYIKLISEKGRD